MNFEEKTFKTEYVYKGKILNLRNDQVTLPDGKTAYREIIEHSGGSCVLCEDGDKVLLVRQFRYAYKENLWEVPAGKLNPNEDPKLTAVRELEEECGIKAERVELLFEVYPTPGYTNEIIRIYKAFGLEKGEVHLDDGEFLESKWIEKDRLKQMIKNGEIKDAKTLIALLTIL